MITKKALTKISDKYVNFVDVFSLGLALKPPKYTGINDCAIKYIVGQQPLYRHIYSLGLVELEIIRAYIETNLANSFIRPSKSPVGAFILFDRKSNSFLQLHVNYWDFKNLTIKDQYLLPLIGVLFDRLGSV